MRQLNSSPDLHIKEWISEQLKITEHKLGLVIGVSSKFTEHTLFSPDKNRLLLRYLVFSFFLFQVGREGI